MPELTDESPAATAKAPVPGGPQKAPPGAEGLPAAAEGAGPAAAESRSDDIEIAGRSETPPAAHGWDLPPAPAAWSYPSGSIAGRDDPERNRPLAAPLAPSLGPEGKRRAPLAVAVLSVCTLGFYALLWHHRANVEVADFDTRMYVRAARSTLAVGVAWLAGLLVSAAGAVLVVTAQMHVPLAYQPPLTNIEKYVLLGGLLIVPYLVLALPFSLIAMVMTLERVRIAEDRVGRPTDVQMKPVATVWWLALPIVGGLILQTLVQRRLNAVWDAVAPRPAARITEY